jgi:hypothetical protein
MEQRGGLGSRFGLELAMEQEAQLPVSQDGRRRVAARDQRLHHGPLRRLPQRIHCYCLPQPVLRRRRLGPRHRTRRQPLQRRQIRLLARLPLRDDPLLRAAFQQRAPVERDGALQRGLVAAGDGCVKGEQVHVRTRQIEEERVRGRRAQAVRFAAQRVTQVGQASTQVVGGLAREAVGPERPREPGAIQFAAVPQGKQGEERLPLAGTQRRERLPCHSHVERSQQPDGQR